MSKDNLKELFETWRTPHSQADRIVNEPLLDDAKVIEIILRVQLLDHGDGNVEARVASSDDPERYRSLSLVGIDDVSGSFEKFSVWGTGFLTWQTLLIFQAYCESGASRGRRIRLFNTLLSAAKHVYRTILIPPVNLTQVKVDDGDGISISVGTSTLRGMPPEHDSERAFEERFFKACLDAERTTLGLVPDNIGKMFGRISGKSLDKRLRRRNPPSTLTRMLKRYRERRDKKQP